MHLVLLILLDIVVVVEDAVALQALENLFLLASLNNMTWELLLTELDIESIMRANVFREC